MNRRIYVCINGICSNPSNTEGWTDRFCTWIHTNTEYRAEKFEYFAGPITRRLFQGKRAKALAKLIAQYKKHDVYLVGHSNGCDLICRALKVLISAQVEQIHLIAPATDADFEKNGLNYALYSYAVNKAFIYVADKDGAMRFANLTGKFLKLFGLGYGTLGLTGPKNIDEDVKNRVEAIHFKEFHHSTFFENQNFDALMYSIVNAR